MKNLLSDKIRKLSSYLKIAGLSEESAKVGSLIPQAEDNYLYHCTFLKNIESIQTNGLMPSSGSNYGGGYHFNSVGRICFSEWDGVSYWFNKMEMLANHHTDNPEEGWIGVTLRIDADYLDDYEVDEPGVRDSRNAAFCYLEMIEPDLLEIWNGNQWVELMSVDQEDMLQTALNAAEIEEDEGELIYWMDFDIFSPENP